MPSFDIVSEVNLTEAENAIANVMREIGTRYDFKGSKSTVEIKEGVVTINADDDLKLKQMHELLQGHMQRRGIAPGSLDYQKEEKAAGQSVRQLGQDQGRDRQGAGQGDRQGGQGSEIQGSGGDPGR